MLYNKVQISNKEVSSNIEIKYYICSNFKFQFLQFETQNVEAYSFTKLTHTIPIETKHLEIANPLYHEIPLKCFLVNAISKILKIWFWPVY